MNVHKLNLLKSLMKTREKTQISYNLIDKYFVTIIN